MKKFNLLPILLLSAIVLLAACGNTDKGNKSSSEGSKGNSDSGKKTEDLLTKVQDEGKLVIGTEGTYPPFSFHDDKGELTGFDVEIAREIAKHLGVEACIFRNTMGCDFRRA